MVFTVGVTEKLGDVEDSESCSPGKIIIIIILN